LSRFFNERWEGRKDYRRGDKEKEESERKEMEEKDKYG
jgi:hypothetical protein